MHWNESNIYGFPFSRRQMRSFSLDEAGSDDSGKQIKGRVEKFVAYARVGMYHQEQYLERKRHSFKGHG